MLPTLRTTLVATALLSALAIGRNIHPAVNDSIRGLATAAGSVSPARGINHPPDRASRGIAPTSDADIQSIDGSGNNVGDPAMGSVNSQLSRLLPSDYSDGIAALAGPTRPTARTVSNAVCAQGESIPNRFAASDFLWQWGQFVDHDVDLTDGVDPPEPADIAVPAGDPWFDPTAGGTVVIAFNRSIYDQATGIDSPRQQLNEITSWIDASNVYGSDAQRADALRTNDGSGRLEVSEGDLLPFNTSGLPNAGGDAPTLFLAGDVRANEQVGLTAMHTLFVREHNRLADELIGKNPGLSGDEIYQHARRIVIAEMQVITYQEFLPALLGRHALAPYRGYDETVDASIDNVFSAAAYRFGHSALNSTILRLDQDGNEIADGHLALRDAFFNPARITDEGGIEPLLRGLAAQVCQAIDTYIVDDVRNFLFGPPGSGGFDLASLNIQRGRDHGLPAYNDARRALGLAAATSFAEISSDPAVQAGLASAYADVEQIDVWVGSLAEDPMTGSLVGELVYTVLKRQFEALRDGDRFWYARILRRNERRDVERTRLSDIIRRNTAIGHELPHDVFHVGHDGSPGCHGSRGGDGTTESDPGDCQPCVMMDSGQVMEDGAKVLLGKINTDSRLGNDRLKIKGAFVLPDTTSFAEIDAVANGARLSIAGDDGTLLVDVVLPGGEFDGTSGWKVSASGAKLTFSDRRRPAAANGIAKLTLQDAGNAAANRVTIQISGKDGNYPITAGDEPIEISVVAGDAAAGQCTMTAFGPQQCRFNGAGNKLSCK